MYFTGAKFQSNNLTRIRPWNEPKFGSCVIYTFKESVYVFIDLKLYGMDAFVW